MANKTIPTILTNEGNVGIGISRTASLNTTTAVNGTGGGNREFVTFTGASSTGFTGTDNADQGYGYFAVTIVSGKSYEVSATMVVTNGATLDWVTSTVLSSPTVPVQIIQLEPVSNTTYRFAAIGNATFVGVGFSRTSGTMTAVVSNFSIKEVGSTLVTSESNVGIGTTSPLKLLHVHGPTGEVVRLSMASSYTAGHGPQLSFWNATTEDLASIRGVFNETSQGNRANLIFGTRTSDALGIETKMTILHDGNVGIGITTPNAKLQIAGTTASLLTVGTLTNDWGGVVAIGTIDGNGIILSKVNTANDTNRVLTLMRDDTNGASIFGYTPVGTSTSVGFQIRASASSYFNGGNVGIGTTNPATKLHVYSAGGGFEFGVGSSNCYIETIDRANTSAFINTSYYTRGTGYFAWSNGSYTERMRIDDAGNVGIGTTVPTYRLDIEGVSTTSVVQNVRNPSTSWNQYALTRYQTDTKNSRYVDVGYFRGVSNEDTRGFVISGLSSNILTLLEPSAYLGLGGVTAPLFNIDVASTQGKGIQLRYDTTTAYLAQITPYWNSSTDTRIDFAINRTANVTPSVIMSVGYDSKVGIGTTAPTGTLTIQSNSNQLRLQTATGPGAYFTNISSFYDSTHPFAIEVANNSSSTTEYFGIYSDAGGANSRPVFPNGNVGIGTTRPSGKLTVQGNIEVNYNSTTADTSVRRSFLTTHATINRGANITFGLFDGGSNPMGMTVYNVAAAAGAYNSQFIAFYTHEGGVNEGERMRITQSGNVGIGTFTPLSLLTVGEAGSTSAAKGLSFGGDASANLYRLAAGQVKTDGQLVAVGGFYSAATAGNYIETLNIGTAVIIEGGVGEGLFLGDSSRWMIGTSDAAYTANADGDLHFRDNTNSVTRMIINYASGFVGIGTVVPVANLEVAGASETVGTIRINGGKVNILAEGEINSSLEFAQRDASVAGLVAGKIASISEFSNGAYAGLGFYTAQQSRVPELKEAVRIKYDGTVGIGTTSPYEKLDVRGGILRTNTRVSNTQLYPLGHYSAGEPIFEIDPSWSEVELQRYFNSSNVTWVAVADAPGGYCIYINGAVEVGAFNGSGFPYIPVDTDDIFYMECWIQNVGLNQTHYMGSQDLDHNFSNLGGNPGSYGYFVMVNSNPTTTWTKVSGYIGGFSATVNGKFEIGTKYWSPMALFNYTAGTGTRACRISGWKVIKVYQPGNRYFSGNIGIGTTSPNTLLNVHGADPFVRINNTSANDQGIKISYNNSDTHGLHLLYNANSAVSYIDNTYPVTSSQVYGDIYFRQNVAGTMTTRMTIKADGGNVGIGTTSPTQKLDIVGSYGTPDDNAGILKIKGPGVGPTQLNFGISGDGGYAWIQATNISIDNDRDIILGPLGGNIGIGITNPLEKLHVTGYILTRSKLAYTQTHDIVKNGLSFYVDFNNKTCFDANISSTSIKDLSNNGYTLNLVNVATIGNKDGNTALYTANNASYLQIVSYVIALPHTWEAWVNGDAFSSWDTIWDSNTERPLIGTFNGVLQVYPSATNCGTLAAGKWYHIVVTANASSVVVTYINGIQTATFAYASTFRTGTGDYWLGGDVGAETFNGYIPIARTYNRVLSATEVMQNYNIEKWRFDSSSTFYHNVADGNVGIGTTNPTAKLVVMGDDVQNYAKSSVPTAIIAGDDVEFLIGTTDNVDGEEITLRMGSVLNTYYDKGAYIKAIQGANVDRFKLAFGTSDGATATTKMTIDNVGNVGIGTTNPLAPLHVGLGGDWPSSTGTSAMVFIKQKSSNVGLVIQEPGNASFDRALHLYTNGSLATIDATYRDTGPYPDIAFVTSGTERVRINSAGNVLIGTTTSTANGGLLQIGQVPNTTASSIGFNNEDNAVISAKYNLVFQIDNTNSVASRSYEWNKGGKGYGDGTNLMTLNAAGKLGIGTVTPLSLLTVGPAGSTSPASGITLGGDAEVNLYRISENVLQTDAAFNVGGSIYSASYFYTAVGQIYGSTYGNLTFFVGNSAGNAWQEGMFIKRGSYVGIGTTNPTGKLHIVSSVAGETVLRTDGTNGTLFSVVDDLSDSLMSVNNSAGLPVLEVFADDRVVAGQYGSGDFVLINNKVGLGTSNPANKLTVIGAASIGSSTYNVAAPSNGLIVEGNVGIGTTNPSYKLDVSASVTNVGRFYNNQTTLVLNVGSTSNTEYTDLQLITSNGNAQFFKQRSSTSWGGADSLNIYTSNGAITFHPAGTPNAVYIDSNGSVGINKTAPTTKLDVVGSFRVVGTTNVGGIFVTGSSATQGNIRPAVAGGTVLISDDSGSSARGLTVSDGGGVIISSVNASYDILTLQIGGTTNHNFDRNGNVGIGLSAPNAARLHIKGNDSDPVLRVESASLVAGTTTASKTFVAWLPIMTGSAAGDKVFIPLFKN